MTAPAVPVSDRVVERVEVTGVVQGVGFRPFVYRLATGLGLEGRVGNDSMRVFVEVSGPAATVDELVRRLRTEAPPLARVEAVTRRPLADGSGLVGGFRIVDSVVAPGPRTLVPPDTAVCDDCVAELFDPTDRRYRHPFITCTNCGPRFTIITGLPYDRPGTTMAGFGLCPACAAEYHDPKDRRYHAQPIACPDCGPTVSFRPTDGEGVTLLADAAIEAARRALAAGRIVAVKGLGGFHLACDATNDEAVARLRQVKHRPDKPFAVMVAGLAPARRLAELGPAAVNQLLAPARPVVLAPARPSALSALVAPGNPLVGVMVAYTPVHHLLLADDMAPLVMTSANLAGEPIIHVDDDVDARLGPLCDGVLGHDRPISTPCDDSVVRVIGDRLLPVRRARGFAPLPVPMPVPTSTGANPAVLAVGGELKNTFCVAADGRAWLSQHLGDMGNYVTLQAFERSVQQFCAFYGISPRVVAVDAHPGYATSAWVRRHRWPHPVAVVPVQHHHAHVAAVMAEHGLDPARPVLGFAFDGSGYGPDGAIWGGEALAATAHGFERLAHLAPVPLPGGDAAVHNPYRMALAHLWAAGIDWSADLPPMAMITADEGRLLARTLERGVACRPTTSMGRLFDAVASLVGLRHTVSFEAQAAIDLELAASACVGGSGPDPVVITPDRYRFGFDGQRLVAAPVIAAIVDDLRAGAEVGAIALAFHRAVAEVVTRVAVHLRDRPESPSRLDTVVLSGGVFQNVLLTELCRDGLVGAGLTVLTHELVPPNDGGLALGQAWVATHRSVSVPAPAPADGDPGGTGMQGPDGPESKEA